MKNKHSLIIILPFLLILFGFMTASFLDEDQTVSFEENRTLQQRPALENGDFTTFTQAYSDYLTEQFPLRASMMKVYSKAGLLSGKILVRNTYVTKDGFLLPKEYKNRLDQADHYLTAVIQAGEFCHKHGIQTYYAILPFKTNALSQADGLSVTDRSVGDFNKKLLLDRLTGGSISLIDVSKYFDAMAPETLKALYFKTDLHWNAKGAYLAGRQILDAMVEKGTLRLEEKPEDDDFIWTTLEETNYQGDLNKRFSNLFSTKEELTYFALKEDRGLQYFLSSDGKQRAERKDIVASGIQQPMIDYNELFTKNYGFLRVVNSNARSGKKIIILKDSLQNPTTDLFCDVFKEVVIIDARYYKEPETFKTLMQKEDPDVLLLMFHEDNISAELAGFLAEDAAS